MNQSPNKKKFYLKVSSTMISALYIVALIILFFRNNLIKEIYSNTVWIELSFILFITYLILYIKDAFIDDFIDLVLEKKKKSFIPHLLEHSLEPFILFLFFLTTTRILLLFTINSIFLKIFVVILTPILYFILKKQIITVNKKGTF